MKKLLACIATLLITLSSLAPLTTVKADTTNLITNPSVETATGVSPTGWAQDKWGTNTTALPMTQQLLTLAQRA